MFFFLKKKEIRRTIIFVLRKSYNFYFYFLYVHTRENGEEIQTNDLYFMKYDPYLIELQLEDRKL